MSDRREQTSERCEQITPDPTRGFHDVFVQSAAQGGHLVVLHFKTRQLPKSKSRIKI